MDATRSCWMLLVLVSIGGGCGGQSFEEGMLAICQSPLEVEREASEAAPSRLVAAVQPPARATAAGNWISHHVTNAEARELFAALAPLPPDQKARRAREAAARAGIARCPLAEVWAPLASP